MDANAKLSMLEEIFEIESGELEKDMDLVELENWDSMTKLSLILLMNDEFDKKLTGKQIRDFKKIRDIIDFMD